jgi:hypothetical protein
MEVYSASSGEELPGPLGGCGERRCSKICLQVIYSKTKRPLQNSGPNCAKGKGLHHFSNYLLALAKMHFAFSYSVTDSRDILCPSWISCALLNVLLPVSVLFSVRL